MTKDIDLSEFKDDFRAQLRALIDAKAKGKEVTVAPEDHHPAPRTINLMDAPKKSLSGSARHNGHNRHAPQSARARPNRLVRRRSS